jgi:hypothetical protein
MLRRRRSFDKQRALVAYFMHRCEAAIARRDDAAGDSAHHDLIQAEARLLRMQGRLTGVPLPRSSVPLPDDVEVVEE